MADGDASNIRRDDHCIGLGLWLRAAVVGKFAVKFVFWLEPPYPAHKGQGAKLAEVDLVELRDERIVGNVGEQVNAERLKLLPLHRRRSRLELDQEQAVDGAFGHGRGGLGGQGGLRGRAIRRNGFVAEADGFRGCGGRGEGETQTQQDKTAGTTGETTGFHDRILGEKHGKHKQAVGMQLY